MEILKTIFANILWAWCKLSCTLFDRHSFFHEDMIGRAYCSNDLCQEEVIQAKSCCCDEEIEFHISWNEVSRRKGDEL